MVCWRSGSVIAAGNRILGIPKDSRTVDRAGAWYDPEVFVNTTPDDVRRSMADMVATTDA